MRSPAGIAVLIIAVGALVGGILFYGPVEVVDVFKFGQEKEKEDIQVGSAFTSNGLGIEFLYPEKWGELKSTAEPCAFGDKFASSHEGEPCLHIFITAPDMDSNPLVMASQSKKFAEHGRQRNQYFGDLFSVARREGVESMGDFIRFYCINEAVPNNAQRCEAKTNPNGVPYVKVFQDLIVEDPDNPEKKALYYLIYNTDHQFDGIIMSSEYISQDIPLEDIEADMDALVSSIKFI